MQSAFLCAIDEGMPGYSGAPVQRAARLGEQHVPKASGAVGLTSALLSANSSGSFGGPNSTRTPRSSNASQEAPDSGNFSLRAAHHSSTLDDMHDSALTSRPQGACAAGRRSEGGKGAALLAARCGEVGGRKPRLNLEASAPDSTSTTGARWTQCWPVRLCADCARC